MITLTSICYHYLARDDEFKRIWGHTFVLLKKHLDFLRDNYEVIDPQDLLAERFAEGKDYMLLTFDDGLREHIKIADYLNELGMNAVFAIPTCILRGESSNPQIIHFGTAYYGIRKFYDLVEREIKKNFSEFSEFLPGKPSGTELMRLHKIVKNLFKREIDHKMGRKVLLNIYSQSLKKDFPDFMERIHLDKDDIRQLVKRGHTLAVHSDSHPVIKDIEDDEELMKKEIVKAKNDLSELIGEEVKIFAYPFGEKADILNNPDYFSKNSYSCVLTTCQQSRDFDKLNLGRYCSQSRDSIEILTKKLWEYKVK